MAWWWLWFLWWLSDYENNFVYDNDESDLSENEKDKIFDEKIKRISDIYDAKYGKSESDFDFLFKQEEEQELAQMTKKKRQEKHY